MFSDAAHLNSTFSPSRHSEFFAGALSVAAFGDGTGGGGSTPPSPPPPYFPLHDTKITSEINNMYFNFFILL